MASKSTITPLFDNVLIKPLAAETKTLGGIYLPENVKEKPQVGEIMAVGKGAFDEDGELMPMVVKVGQKVLYKKWGGDEYKVGNEEWKLVKQTEILAIVE
ncbi:MAG TPA: co-chaperone GroES [Patescibacteria group bacterium]|nr:co-chaperone GroES [Patescibacteria group bacterium]